MNLYIVKRNGNIFGIMESFNSFETMKSEFEPLGYEILQSEDCSAKDIATAKNATFWRRFNQNLNA